MIKILRYAALLLLPLAPASAGESAQMLKHGIAATLTLPDGEGPFPAVLMMHGLGSSQNEVGNLLLDAADALAEEGIASMRFDFRGFGKSLGDTGAFTLDRQSEDARTALAALQNAPDIDPAHIGVLGFSFGGGAAIELAAAEPGVIRSVVVWAPVGDYAADMRESMGQRAFDRAAEDGIAGIDFGWRTMALRKAFFDSLLQRDLYRSLQSYAGAFLIINGEDDPYRKYAEPMIEAAAGFDKQAVVIEGADHIFNVYQPGQSKVAELMELTVRRFSRTLVIQ